MSFPALSPWDSLSYDSPLIFSGQWQHSLQVEALSHLIRGKVSLIMPVSPNFFVQAPNSCQAIANRGDNADGSNTISTEGGKFQVSSVYRITTHPNKPFHSQEWSSSNFSCSLNSNITSHSMKNLVFHSLLRLKDDSCTSSHYLTYTFHFKKVGRMYFLSLGLKGFKCGGAWIGYCFSYDCVAPGGFLLSHVATLNSLLWRRACR